MDSTTSTKVISVLLDEITRWKEKKEDISTEGMELWYFDGPGRGEMTRLCFVAGGVDFKDVRIKMAEFGPIKSDPNSPPGKCFGSMPVLKLSDGTLVAQSIATAQCAAQIALGPGTVQSRAADAMYAGAHADMQSAMYKCLFGSDESKAAGKEALPATAEKFLIAIERMLPAEGFINGGSGPTLGDLALFDVCTSPFPGLISLGVDLSPYPKLTALVSKIKEVPRIAAYCAKRGF